MAESSSSRPGGARGQAAALVAEWLERGTFADVLLQGLSRDRGFLTEVVNGTLRWYRALDYVRAVLAPRQPRANVHALLLTSSYELLFMDHSEAYAVVDQSVEAARAMGGPKVAGFVNALLRRVAGDPKGWRARIDQQPPAVRWSHPDLLIQRWHARYGLEGLAGLCQWNNGRPEVVLRVETSRVSLRSFCERLDLDRVRHHPHPARPDECLCLEQGGALDQLPGYAEGWFAVHDPSTLAAVDLLAAQPGERVLDACAAPGGKTLALASRMKGEGELLALDVEPNRLRRVVENVTRMGQGWVKTALIDLTQNRRDLADASFDAVLLDVPCTNTGVLRRRPDARWRFDEPRLAGALDLQRRLLDAAAPLVKTGGRLVYSTCSLEAEENADQVRTWLARNPGFVLEDERALVPPGSQTDGAYAARLRRG